MEIRFLFFYITLWNKNFAVKNHIFFHIVVIGFYGCLANYIICQGIFYLKYITYVE